MDGRRKLNVRIKPHALVRMKERQIKHNHVEQVLASPTETIGVRFSRQASFGNVNGRRLLIIYQINADAGRQKLSQPSGLMRMD